MISRQVKWQRDKKAKGLCTICGKKPLATKNACRDCADKNSKRNKERYKEKEYERKLHNE